MRKLKTYCLKLDGVSLAFKHRLSRKKNVPELGRDFLEFQEGAGMVWHPAGAADGVGMLPQL